MLIAVASPAVRKAAKDDTSEWHSMLLGAHRELTSGGFYVDVVSTSRQQDRPVEPSSSGGRRNWIDNAFLVGAGRSSTYVAMFADAPHFSTIDPSGYNALVVLGARRAMAAMVRDEDFRAFIVDFYEASKIVAVVGYATCVLLKARLSDGTLLVTDRTWTGVANAEMQYGEPSVGDDRDRLSIEDEARKIPKTRFVVAERFKRHAVKDGRLITAQQQYSASAAAALVVEELGAALPRAAEIARPSAHGPHANG